MSVPAKYRAIGDFHEYYSGARVAPYLTLFVGGNHEASAYLRELPYGGWVAPNIYYLGYANVIRFGGLKIAGLSGIWKGHDYNRPHDERLPLSFGDQKSAYHVREWDIRKLLQVKSQVDVGISHDWPRGIEWKGDSKWLFQRKQGFETDALTGKLGSEGARQMLRRLRPKWWFSAHLHVKYAAAINWDKEDLGEKDKAKGDGKEDILVDRHINGSGNPNEIPLNGEVEVEQAPLAPVHNDEEIDLDMDDDDELAPAPSAPSQANNDKTRQVGSDPVPEDLRSQLPASFSKPRPEPAPQTLPPPEAITNKITHFLALDKCLPNRKFLQIMDIDPISETNSSTTEPPQLTYDKEWLAVTRVFAREGDPTRRFSAERALPPNKGEGYYAPLIEAEMAWVDEHIIKWRESGVTIPENFEQTAAVYDPSVSIQTTVQPFEYTNPQTVAFCEMLGIENHFDATEKDRAERRQKGPQDEKVWRGQSNAAGGEGSNRWQGRGRGRGGCRGFQRGRGRGRGRGF